MGIQSLGVGSGLALDDLVTQLIQAEREPQENRLNEREETLDAVISGLGSLKSKLSDFEDSVDELRNDFNLNARKPQIDDPSSLNLNEGESGPFTAEASNSAVEASYDISIERLASGTELQTLAGDFSASTDVVNSSGAAQTLDFAVSGSFSFQISVANNATLENLRDAINSDANNQQTDGSLYVTASIIDDGLGNSFLRYASDVTGTGNDLTVTSSDASLDKVATSGTGTLATAQQALNAQAKVDGIDVESATNEFQNVISNVSFTANSLSPDDGGTRETSKLTIGNDKDGLTSKIRDFVDDYNTLITEIGSLTRFGESELEEDGALAGDFMVRSIQTSLANLISNNVPASAVGTLFQIGVSFDDDGKLEITAADEFGLGSGEDRLKESLEDSFDDVATLFTDSSNGIASNLYEYIREFTQFGGLLQTREKSFKDQKDSLDDERAAFELQMLSFEQIQRDKYIALDKTVAQLNQTGQALLASLGSA